jgi:hypothetical protein
VANAQLTDRAAGVNRRPASALATGLSRRAISIVVFATCLCLYVLTLQPGLSWGDGTRLQREAVTGESFILAEMVQVEFAHDPWPLARLGVAAWDHPLYVALGYGLVSALPGADPLWLVNLLSALFGAGTCALVCAICLRHTASYAAALLAAGSLALSHTFWFHSVTPEVYTLLSFLLLLSLYAFDRYEAGGQLGFLAVSAFSLGLAASNHLLAFLALPALAAYLAWQNIARNGYRQMAAGWHRPAVTALVAFTAGFSLYLVQLARMLRTFAPTDVMGPVVGDTFLRGLLGTSALDLVVSLLTYAVFVVLQFGPAGAGLAVYGLLAGARAGAINQPAPDTSGALALRHKLVALFSAYATFGVLYRVADQFAFFMTSYVVLALALGLGAARLLHALDGWRRLVAAALLASALGLLPLVYEWLPSTARAAGLTDESLGIPQIGSGVRDGLAYYVKPSKRGDYSAEMFGRRVLQALPPDSLVLAQWYTDTDEYFVLRYYIAVEGMRPDVRVEGWPTIDPFAFDSQLARNLIVAEVSERPIYLASLSEKYYDVAWLMQHYCIIVEHSLYRVMPAGHDTACLR